jgi:U6 snRNA-associated Sm-like protein LSm5
MVLEDVIEFDYTGTQTKLPKILLNGNNVCMVSHLFGGNDLTLGVWRLIWEQLIPGGEGPVAAS